MSERSRWVHVETTAAPTPEHPEQSVSEGDTDLPNDNSTPGRVAVGGSATGAIGTPGDQDRFAVGLQAGRTYRFDLTGSPSGGGTLPDTFLRAIYNSEGQYQPDSYNDDFEGSRDSRVTFTPTEAGTYYARVSGDRDEVGSYTLSVTETHILVGVGALPGPGAARAVDKTSGCVMPQHVIDRLEGVPKGQRRAEGIKIVVEQIHELQEIPGVSGVDIMDLKPDSWFPTAEIVEAAGLANRPEPSATVVTEIGKIIDPTTELKK